MGPRLRLGVSRIMERGTFDAALLQPQLTGHYGTCTSDSRNFHYPQRVADSTGNVRSVSSSLSRASRVLTLEKLSSQDEDSGNRRTNDLAKFVQEARWLFGSGRVAISQAC